MVSVVHICIYALLMCFLTYNDSPVSPVTCLIAQKLSLGIDIHVV